MGWWIFAVLVAVLPIFKRARDRQRALPAASPTPALEPAAHALRSRLVGVDSAIGEVRSLLRLVTPQGAQQCATMAVAAVGANRRSDAPSADGTGPGTAAFAQLLIRLAAIAQQDLRELSDAGLERSTIVTAINAPHPPERWRHELVARLNYWQQGVNSLRARRYG